MLAKGLPDDPMVFTMAHELKHHLVDSALPIACCSERNINEHIEIGAEVFTSELIFPEQDFLNAIAAMGVRPGSCTAETIVRLKHDSQTTLSYTGLAKRASFHRLSPAGSFDGIKWKKLEEKIFGEPLYKKIMRHRRHM